MIISKCRRAEITNGVARLRTPTRVGAVMTKVHYLLLLMSPKSPFQSRSFLTIQPNLLQRDLDRLTPGCETSQWALVSV